LQTESGENTSVSILKDIGGWDEAIYFLYAESRVDGEDIIRLVNYFDSKTYSSSDHLQSAESWLKNGRADNRPAE